MASSDIPRRLRVKIRDGSSGFVSSTSKAATPAPARGERMTRSLVLEGARTRLPVQGRPVIDGTKSDVADLVLTAAISCSAYLGGTTSALAAAGGSEQTPGAVARAAVAMFRTPLPPFCPLEVF